MDISCVKYRQKINTADLQAIARIVESSGFFSAAEIDLALELANDKITHGQNSSYQFLFGEADGFVWGYTCFGLIPATAASYDLYWIAVDNNFRTQGLGKQLLGETENIIRKWSGQHIYAETSSREQYRATRLFYESCGYMGEAFLKDFYAESDSKVIYSKILI